MSATQSMYLHAYRYAFILSFSIFKYVFNVFLFFPLIVHMIVHMSFGFFSYNLLISFFFCDQLTFFSIIWSFFYSLGFMTDGPGQWARLCCRLNIWLLILVILFYAHVALESPKKNYTKEKTATDKRRRRFFYTFLYLLGSTTIPWMREFFLNTLKWLNPPVKMSKIR